MNGGQIFYRLQFRQDDTFDNQIRSESLFKGEPGIPDQNGFLALNLQALIPQQLFQHDLINRLQQPRPQIPMKTKCTIHKN